MQACGVAVSHELTTAEIEDFVDPKLQHGKSALKDTSCDQNIEELQMPTSWKSNRHEDLVLYREIMRYDYDNNIGNDNESVVDVIVLAVTIVLMVAAMALTI